eukprot:scaffold323390_cov24-Tisochrysis_lutea.AAC.2
MPPTSHPPDSPPAVSRRSMGTSSQVEKNPFAGADGCGTHHVVRPGRRRSPQLASPTGSTSFGFRRPNSAACSLASASQGNGATWARAAATTASPCSGSSEQVE